MCSAMIQDENNDIKVSIAGRFLRFILFICFVAMGRPVGLRRIEMVCRHGWWELRQRMTEAINSITVISPNGQPVNLLNLKTQSS